MNKYLFFLLLFSPIVGSAQLQQGDSLPNQYISHLKAANGSWQRDSSFESKISVLVFTDLKTPEVVTLHHDLAKIANDFPQLQLILVDEGPIQAEYQEEFLQLVSASYSFDFPLCTDTNQYLLKKTPLKTLPGILVVGPGGEVLGSRSADHLYYQFESAFEQVAQKFSNQLSSKTFFIPKNESVKPLGPINYLPSKTQLAVGDPTTATMYFTSLKGKKTAALQHEAFVLPYRICEADSPWAWITDPHGNRVFSANLSTKECLPIMGNGAAKRISAPKKKWADPLPQPMDVFPLFSSVVLSSLGMHQLWDYYTTDSTAYFYAGDGYKANHFLDGYRYEGRIAYPTQIEMQNKRLVFADAGLKKIRQIANGKLSTPSFYYGTQIYQLSGFTFCREQLFVLDGYQKKLLLLNEKKGRYVTFIDLSEERKVNDEVFPTSIESDGTLLYIGLSNRRFLVIDPVKKKVKNRKWKSF